MRSRLIELAVQILVMAIVISVTLLFIGIGILALIHVCIAGRSLRRNFHDNEERRETNRTHGVSSEELKKMPVYQYSMQEKEKDCVECVVCLEMYRDGEMCRLLPQCKHTFHANCIDSWLLKAAICPTCRTSVKKCIGNDGLEGIQIQ